MAVVSGSGNLSSTFETLEDRRLLSASPVGLHGGNLMVKGTKGADTVVFALDQANASQLNVTVNGVTRSFDLARIRRIKVDAKAGNDNVSFDETNGAIFCRSELIGGKGDDVLSGGSGKDKLLGAQGNDTLTGNAGADQLIGAAGNDNLGGGDGNDRLRGGGGDDTLDGGADQDTIQGDGGKDHFAGGDGSTEIKDRTSNDTQDELTGGGGGVEQEDTEDVLV